MAEIKIEKKKPVWPWIVAALVIAALVYFIFFWDKNDEQEVIQETTDVTNTDTVSDEAQTMNGNGEVAAYIAFIENNRNNMGLDHEFTNEAFTKLIAATEAKAADVNYDITRDMTQVKEYADKITNDPYETTHANSIGKAATTLAGILQGIQQNSYPDLSADAGEVMSAANSIDPSKLTLDQKDTVKSFFDEASDLLNNMNK